MRAGSVHNSDIWNNTGHSYELNHKNLVEVVVYCKDPEIPALKDNSVCQNSADEFVEVKNLPNPTKIEYLNLHGPLGLMMFQIPQVYC